MEFRSKILTMCMFTLSNMMAVPEVTYEIVLTYDDFLRLLCDFIRTIFDTTYGAPLINILNETFYAICNLINEGFTNDDVIEKLISDEGTVKNMIMYFVEALKIATLPGRLVGQMLDALLKLISISKGGAIAFHENDGEEVVEQWTKHPNS